MEGTSETIQPDPLTSFLRRKTALPKATYCVGQGLWPVVQASYCPIQGSSLLWLWMVKDCTRNVAQGAQREPRTTEDELEEQDVIQVLLKCHLCF